MPRTVLPLADPSADAAAVLRRLGFWLLLFAAPVGALFSRRAVVIVAPLAVALLVLAAALDRGSRLSAGRLRQIAVSPGGLAGLLMIFWAALSLVWTPFLAEASERLLNLVGMLLMAAVGYVVLPDRMRSANLYMLPVGIALTALAAIVMGLRHTPMGDPDGQSLERGLVVLVLLLWPAVAWLHSRGRNLETLILAVIVALASLLAPNALPLEGLAAGALIFALTAFAPSFGSLLAASLMAGLMLLAPVVPFLMKPLAASLFGSGSTVVAGLDVWRATVVSEPLRLVTGHGLETALRARFVGLLAPDAPSNALFEIWYELGLVGAAAGATIVFSCVTGSVGGKPPLIPGILAAFASAFTFGCMGIGMAQIWWFTALILVALIFVAIERGQFRTKRPKAVLRRGREFS